MAINIDLTESQPDFQARIATASIEDLEEAIIRYNGVATTVAEVNLMRIELYRRQRTVTWKLSTETRVIAWLALALTLAQLVLQLYQG